jgi:coenzyme F420-reducing hydrogenase delta subunit
MLSVNIIQVIFNVAIKSIITLGCRYDKCHYADSHGADSTHFTF